MAESNNGTVFQSWFTDQSRGADLQYQVVWLLLRAKKIPTVKQVGILSFTTLPKV